LNKAILKLKEFLSSTPTSGSANPGSYTFYETEDISLQQVMSLYDRDPTCKSSVDLLAASAVKRFYTTCPPNQEKAKNAIDEFCASANLDSLLHEMAVRLIACGNDFWLKLTPKILTEFVRMPIDAIEKMKSSSITGLKIPHKPEGYILRNKYCGNSGQTLTPEAVLHWSINTSYNTGFGVGLLQVLLHSLTQGSDKRPSFAWMKAKIEKIMPKIFEKYAGPDVLAVLPNADPVTIQKFENAIKNRDEEGVWLFYGGKEKAVQGTNVFPVTIDPRARFEYYLDHMVNQFYLGCETPLPRLFSTPGFTEASARAALELQDMLIDPIQRMIKRRVEREIFTPILRQNGFDPAKNQVRLNWGNQKAPELTASDLISAADKGLIRKEEFRKNAIKILGWELWEEQSQNAISTETKP
jgi:hypothetical protein